MSKYTPQLLPTSTYSILDSLPSRIHNETENEENVKSSNINLHNLKIDNQIMLRSKLTRKSKIITHNVKEFIIKMDYSNSSQIFKPDERVNKHYEFEKQFNQLLLNYNKDMDQHMELTFYLHESDIEKPDAKIAYRSIIDFNPNGYKIQNIKYIYTKETNKKMKYYEADGEELEKIDHCDYKLQFIPIS